MGFFDHLQKKGAGTIQAQKPQIRKVEHKPTLVKSASVPPGHLAKSASSPALNRSATTTTTSSRSGSASTFNNNKSSQRLSRRNDGGSLKPTPRSKSVVRKRPTAVPRLCSSSDESDTDASSFDLRLNKRVKVSASAEPDLKRRVRSEEAFATTNGDDDGTSDMVHAANITEVKKAPEFTSAFNEDKEPEVVSLQYPSASQKERYQLVVPREKDGFRPLDDIVQVIETISENYVPEEHQYLFNDDQTSLKRSLRRALAQGSFSDFQASIEKYNGIISKLRDDGIIAKHLDGTHSLSLPLVERVLTQVYSRTVSPRVESLRQYENGTDYVYGELLPRFVTDVFKKTGLKSDDVFVDLGSGVGNVVLQSALEIGCESWGCEIMQNASELADLQHVEFKARCRLWGLAPGDVHLVKGDFLEEERMAKVLRRADVVLINNQAFTPETNDRLINHFLDMKEGCRIVSLKSFVPTGHKIQARNLNSPVNLLSVAEHNYWSDCVSWTNAGGSYFIAKKDSSKLRAFSKNLR